MAGSASSRGSACNLPPGPWRAWWELWAHIQAGVSGQRESQPARILGTNRRPKMLAGPLPSWPMPRGALSSRQKLKLYWLQRLKGGPPQGRGPGEIPRGYQVRARGFNLLAPLRNLMTRSCFPRDLPSTASWCAAIATYTLRVEGDSLRSNPSCRKEARLRSGIYGGPPGGENTNRRTGSTSACKLSRRQGPGRSDSVYYRWR